MCCSVLHCVAACCCMLHFAAGCDVIYDPLVAAAQTAARLFLCACVESGSRCNILQHTAVCHYANDHTPDFVCAESVTHCNTLQHTATHFNTLQHATVQTVQSGMHCGTMQRTATHCNTLQHKATSRCADGRTPVSFPEKETGVLQCVAVCCVALRRVAVCCSV